MAGHHGRCEPGHHCPDPVQWTGEVWGGQLLLRHCGQVQGGPGELGPGDKLECQLDRQLASTETELCSTESTSTGGQYITTSIRTHILRLSVKEFVTMTQLILSYQIMSSINICEKYFINSFQGSTIS